MIPPSDRELIIVSMTIHFHLWRADSFEKSNAEMCYFHGESLAPGTMLNDTGNPCDVGCMCELEGPYEEYNVTK